MHDAFLLLAKDSAAKSLTASISEMGDGNDWLAASSQFGT